MNKEIILITGASSDIGIEILKKISSKKNIILATYNKNDLKSFVKKEKNILEFKVDFSKQKELINFINLLSKKNLIPSKFIHIASNPLQISQFTKLNYRDFEKCIDIQLRSLIMILKKIIPSMKKNNFGKIVVLLSSVTIGEPPSSMSPYVTSKYAMLGLIKSIASEYSKNRIAINAISPGMIETKFLSNIPNKIYELNRQRVPFGRNVEIKDIVPLVEFLLSDKSSFITGTNIPVTGGLNF